MKDSSSETSDAEVSPPGRMRNACGGPSRLDLIGDSGATKGAVEMPASAGDGGWGASDVSEDSVSADEFSPPVEMEE